MNSFDIIYNEIIHTIGFNIHFFRRTRNMTQEQLAEKANISIHYLSTLEAAKKGKQPTLKVLCRIACALGITLGQLLEPKNFE